MHRGRWRSDRGGDEEEGSARRSPPCYRAAQEGREPKGSPKGEVKGRRSGPAARLTPTIQLACLRCAQAGSRAPMSRRGSAALGPRQATQLIPKALHPSYPCAKEPFFRCHALHLTTAGAAKPWAATLRRAACPKRERAFMLLPTSTAGPGAQLRVPTRAIRAPGGRFGTPPPP